MFSFNYIINYLLQQNFQNHKIAGQHVHNKNFVFYVREFTSKFTEKILYGVITQNINNFFSFRLIETVIFNVTILCVESN